METTTLYYRQGGSDKVYQARIEPKDDGFVVNFAFGRRGSTLQTGTKTSTPVSEEAARRIFARLIQEKEAKGYTPGEDGTPYHGTAKEGQALGIHCQLLNPIDESELATLFASPEYWMQEKHDGRRMLVRKAGETIIGINRLGLSAGLPQSIVTDTARWGLDLLLDGEAVCDELFVFDVLQIAEEDLRPLPYLERYLRLMNVLGSFPHPSIRLVQNACVGAEKLKLFDELKARGREGVVFKKIDQPYTAGRPASGGPQLKFKFCETASFIVGGINGKRSVGLILQNGDRPKCAGNVTIPANHAIPEIGSVVDVRFLYAFKESGRIFQPVYLGVRNDIPKEECTVDQLKYKAESAELP